VTTPTATLTHWHALPPNNTIVYVGCDDKSDSHFDELSAMRADLQAMRNIDSEPFNLVELPLPDAIYDEDGERLPATYANFLILNNAVLLPVYGQQKNGFSCAANHEDCFSES